MILTALTALALTAAPDPAPQQLGGCFQVTYRFVEDGVHDYGPEQLLERIVVTTTDDSTTVAHHQVGPGGSRLHFSELWRHLSPGDAAAWRQTILGPDGAPRYECDGTFTFKQRSCVALNAPKPRRDAARTDYVTLDRESTLQLTPAGWIQAERNVKRDAGGVAVSNEVGWIEYARQEQARCATPYGGG